MDTAKETEKIAGKNRTTVERTSDRELVTKRTINGPARLVFDAWTKPELFGKWWLPASHGLLLMSCDMDARTGGGYKLVIRHGEREPMAFFGKYLEVTPHSRIVWTNDEGDEPGAISTVTLEEKGGKTLQIMHEIFPSKAALDAAMSSGEKDCVNETFDQLDEILATGAVRPS